MLCVGETLAQREAGKTEAVVVEQLRAGLIELTVEQVRRIPIAYEPVWAIGTGKNATPSDASAVHAVIRRTLVEIGGEEGKHPPGGDRGRGHTGDVVTLL